jgi:mono/diheme cytochrome c family protein
MMRKGILTVLGCVALTGCIEQSEMPVAAEGQALYMQNCSVCHGENGKGAGPMARAMARPPADLTLISLRNDDVFPRAKVMSKVDGYAKSDLNSSGMPEFGGLLEGDLIPFDGGDGILTPTPRKLVALVAYIETLQQ